MPETKQVFSDAELLDHFAAEYSQWNQKKRPAIRQFRAGLATLARELRAKRGNYGRIDEGPTTEADRHHIRMLLLQRYRRARAFLLEADAEEEREFWMLLKKFGLCREGGVQ